MIYANTKLKGNGIEGNERRYKSTSMATENRNKSVKVEVGLGIAEFFLQPQKLGEDPGASSLDTENKKAIALAPGTGRDREQGLVGNGRCGEDAVCTRRQVAGSRNSA